MFLTGIHPHIHVSGAEDSATSTGTSVAHPNTWLFSLFSQSAAISVAKTLYHSKQEHFSACLNYIFMWPRACIANAKEQSSSHHFIGLFSAGHLYSSDHLKKKKETRPRNIQDLIPPTHLYADWKAAAGISFSRYVTPVRTLLSTLLNISMHLKWN